MKHGRRTNLTIAGIGTGAAALVCLFAAVTIEDKTTSISRDQGATLGAREPFDAAALHFPDPGRDARSGIQPVLSDGGITFAIPREAPFWIWLNVRCYLAMQALFEDPSGSGTPSLIEKSAMSFSWLPEALKELDFIPGEDIFEVMTLGVGPDSTVAITGTLRRPERLEGFLRRWVLSGAIANTSNHRFGASSPIEAFARFDTPDGPRRTDIRAVPIDWSAFARPDQPPSTAGAWVEEAMKATHVIFITSGQDTAEAATVDLATREESLEIVRRIDALSPDPRNRCVMGAISGLSEKVAGSEVQRLQFVAAAPPITVDPTAKLFGLNFSPTAVVRLSLRPLPTEEAVESWLTSVYQRVDDAILGYSGAFQHDPEIGRLLRSVIAHRIAEGQVEITASTRNVTMEEIMAAGG